MASVLDVFFESPSEGLFDQLTKEQLLEVAARYEICLTTKEKKLKESVALIVKAALVKLEVFDPVKPVGFDDDDSAAQSSVIASTFSFEQRKELMLLEIEKAKLNREIEIRKLEVEALRFQLIGEGKIGDSISGLTSSVRKGLDVANNIRLIPKFRNLETCENLQNRRIVNL